jgi:hypothetical protein
MSKYREDHLLPAERERAGWLVSDSVNNLRITYPTLDTHAVH